MHQSFSRLFAVVAASFSVAPVFAAPTTAPSASPTTAPSVASTPTTAPSKVASNRPTKGDFAAAQALAEKFRPFAGKVIPLLQSHDAWSDAVKRKEEGAKVQPELAQSLTLIDDTAGNGHPLAVQLVGATPFIDVAAVFGDADVQKQLAEMAQKPGDEGAWAKVAMASAKYWVADNDAAARGKALDGLAALVKSDPETKDAVARTEGEFYENKPSKEIADRIDTYVTTTLGDNTITMIKADQKVDAVAADFKKAGNDPAAQGKVLDALESMAQSDPETRKFVDNAEIGIYMDNPSKEIADRIEAYETAQKNPRFAQAKMQHEAELKQEALVGKPMVLAGLLKDGTQFSTADLKGKVILVDFWASWCGPCKAELPRVKKEYADMHSKGLEVIGVSFDQTDKALTAFLAANPDMPWPQMFDPKHAFWNNEFGKKYGIMGIPTMFLIDKNGICRSVKAREDFETEIPKLLAENGAV
jgi:thiol-disulfide isomerase/thioredoxin/cytochrome c551/c552